MTEGGRFPPNLGFFLILPDALAQGLVPAIGDYLAQYDLYPVAVTTEILSEKHRAVLYNEGFRSKYSESGRIHGRKMTRSLLALDNCLAVLVTGGAPDQDVSRLLHELKGQSSFLQRKPGSLRDLSSSADRCMSLIHTPDDAVEAARDAALFFPTVDTDAKRGSRELDWDFVPACRGWAVPSPHQSRYSIAVRTILRCAALPLGETDRRYTSTDYRALWLIYDICRTWLKVPPVPNTFAENQRFLSLCADLDPPATVLAKAAAVHDLRDEMFAQIIVTLVRPAAFDHDEGLRLLERLDRARLMLSPYESHHLLTLMTFLND